MTWIELAPTVAIGIWSLVVVASLLIYLFRILFFIGGRKGPATPWKGDQTNHTEPFEVVRDKIKEWKEGDITISKWFHKKPGTIENEVVNENEATGAGNKYFAPIYLPESNKLITILIPFYNEQFEEILDTLESLYENMQNIEGYTFSFLLVQDGWSFASATMKENLIEMFKIEDPWQECYNKDVDAGESVSYVLQRIDEYGNIAPTRLQGRKHEEMLLNLTVIVKKDNRKKHNSHEWFFSSHGFCGAYNPKYCFATDCSTLFAPDCMQKLITKIRQEQNCVVVTGKQVVKTAEQQRVEKENFFEKWLRMVQGYDFESSFAAFMGAFAEFGFLPVVPGPCGLYRWELLKGKSLSEYFKIVNKPVHDCGIIENNLKIAEDRILSYFSVFYASVPAKMSLCPDAEFYFDAETNLIMFVKQRRRWINGTSAGYVYIAQHPELILGSELPLYKCLSILALFLCQLAIYTCLAITPAIFLCCFYQSVHWVLPEVNGKDFALYLVVLYTLYYLFFQFIHIKYVYLGWSFFLHIFLGAFTVTLSAIASCVYIVSSTIELSSLQYNSYKKCYTIPDEGEQGCVDVISTITSIAILIIALTYAISSPYTSNIFQTDIKFFIPAILSYFQ